jgi:shikimate dehydrogenase
VNNPRRLLLIGHPVAHSLSPRFQNAAIKAAGISAEYRALDVAPGDLARVAAQLRARGYAGNVTVPYKAEMAALCDSLSPLAAQTGCVNTYVTRDGLLVGYNTDVGGFTHAVRALLGREPRNERVVVLGAGGAASAVLSAVHSWPDSNAWVVNRSADRLGRLLERFPERSRAARSVAEVPDPTILVNATSIGMSDERSPLDPSGIPSSAAVLDLVYRTRETGLVRAARARGLLASDGREMLLEQGALAFAQWFDVAPDRMVMRRSLVARNLRG